MSVMFVSLEGMPTYIAKSTDITSGSILGTPLLGKTVYTVDDQKWFIVGETSGSSYFLYDYVMPALQT